LNDLLGARLRRQARSQQGAGWPGRAGAGAEHQDMGGRAFPGRPKRERQQPRVTRRSLGPKSALWQSRKKQQAEDTDACVSTQDQPCGF